MTVAHVRVESLRCQVGSRRLLDVDQLVISGGATAVLGPNGAGKSTLLRTLATVSNPRGAMWVDGQPVGDGASLAAVRSRLGYVPQANGLPPRMRVHDYLDYLASLKEIGPARLRNRWISYTLAQVDLVAAQRVRIKTLSGGEQRRLTIAQALLGSPELLIMDEPLTALDAQRRTKMVTSIVEWSTTATVVVATHHGDELAAVCDRVVVLSEGRVVFHDSPDVLARKAAGRTWETSTNEPGLHARAVGPGRFRCVGSSVPAEHEAVEPSLADGYVALMSDLTQ